jgi:single-strand DNA-binding protein
MLNKLILIGYVGKEPEIKPLSSGEHMARFSLATSERWKDATTGERRDKTTWHQIVVFGQLTVIIKEHVRKGSRLYLEGKQAYRDWEDDKGIKRTVGECVLQGPRAKLVLLDHQKGEHAPEPGSSEEYGGYGSGGHDDAQAPL